MCSFCERMEDLVSTTFIDGEKLEAVLVPVSCGKDFSPAYILIKFDPMKNGIKGNCVYQNAFAVSYCPKCGRKIERKKEKE